MRCISGTCVFCLHIMIEFGCSANRTFGRDVVCVACIENYEYVRGGLNVLVLLI